ncbi:hypothetical protein FRX31_033972 [Thalictrum thalictroides]|uniref:Uncharacterized protein n=1 Tax=Thalictrum thalictroides TaxID=46969 RepID=A0A7J6UVF3_THATH|nr:hypothetical protein FRX31_033972 [Thalictrum thalictroides]
MNWPSFNSRDIAVEIWGGLPYVVMGIVKHVKVCDGTAEINHVYRPNVWLEISYDRAMVNVWRCCKVYVKSVSFKDASATGAVDAVVVFGFPRRMPVLNG